MISHYSRGVVEGSLNILTAKARIFLKDIFNRIASGKKFQNGLDGDPRAADDGPAITNVRIDCDALCHEDLIITCIQETKPKLGGV
jgi:hypothetical protein